MFNPDAALSYLKYYGEDALGINIVSPRNLIVASVRETLETGTILIGSHSVRGPSSWLCRGAHALAGGRRVGPRAPEGHHQGTAARGRRRGGALPGRGLHRHVHDAGGLWRRPAAAHRDHGVENVAAVAAGGARHPQREEEGMMLRREWTLVLTNACHRAGLRLLLHALLFRLHFFMAFVLLSYWHLFDV